MTALISQLGLEADDLLALYKGGICYYNIPVKHFGDTDTPLEENQKITKPSDYKQTQLGRFGIVRNNWYHINIESISNIGEPTIPNPDPTDPDDHPKTEMQAISFTINMLNWAKRTQTENF